MRASKLYVNLSHAWFQNDRYAVSTPHATTMAFGSERFVTQQHNSGAKQTLEWLVHYQQCLVPIQEVRRQVRFQIIRNARTENVGESQSCMVSKVRMTWKQALRAAGWQGFRKKAQVDAHRNVIADRECISAQRLPCMTDIYLHKYTDKRAQHSFTMA